MTGTYRGANISALSALVAAVFLAVGLAAAVKPKIVFERDSWDFGRVKQAETLDCEFVFKNGGQATLLIKNVETSCGCTAALVSEKKVEPGGEGRIKVSFNSAGYGGRVTKHVTVESNDPDQPRIQLKVTADIETPPQPKVELSPYTAEVGLVLQGEPVEAELILRNRGELELIVECEHKKAEFFSGGKSLAFPLKIAAGKEKRVTLRLALPDRAGVLREYVLFRSNDPSRQAVSFALSGFIVTRAEIKAFLDKHKTLFK